MPFISYFKGLRILVVCNVFVSLAKGDCDSSAPSGYEKRNGKYYKLYGKKGQGGATIACDNDNALLAMIKDSEDFQAAKHYFQGKCYVLATIQTFA